MVEKPSYTRGCCCLLPRSGDICAFSMKGNDCDRLGKQYAQTESVRQTPIRGEL